ncbi:MAG: glycosyltransferase [Proteobacteria bacterium]|jgi:glycosyltransferase involved in cell wall biosynthesis|nr:glycosyltransferase [Pseudomonadota bacterium]
MNDHIDIVNDPEISVVLPVFNGASTLSDSINSVLGQTFENFELLIVDDGSDDRKMDELLSALSASDKRIKLIRQSNSGITGALVNACQRAKGKYLARIDNGDCMSKSRLLLQYEYLEKFPDCVLLSSSTKFFDPNWEYLYTVNGIPESDSPSWAKPSDAPNGVNADISHHGSVMIRCSAYEAVGGYRKEFYFGQDWDLWYRLFEIGSYGVLSEACYLARHFPTSISLVNSAAQRTIARCSHGAYRARLNGQDETPFLRQAAQVVPERLRSISNSDASGSYFIGELLRRNGNEASCGYLKRAWSLTPWNMKYFIRYCQSLPLRS